MFIQLSLVHVAIGNVNFLSSLGIRRPFQSPREGMTLKMLIFLFLQMKLVSHGKSSKPTENLLQYWPKSIDVLKKTFKIGRSLVY